MAKIATWGDHTFEISSDRIYGFEELKIKAQRKTEDEEKKTSTYGKQTFTKKGVAQPTEISLKAKIYKALGVDPLTESKSWLSDAHAGKRDYLIINGQKVLGCTVRLVTAEVSDISINANGTWSSCEVSCTFKQSGAWPNEKGKKSDESGSSSNSGSSGKKSSKKKSNTIVIAGTAGRVKVPSSSSGTSSRMNRKRPSVKKPATSSTTRLNIAGTKRRNKG